jgi:hypothetical protein
MLHCIGHLDRHLGRFHYIHIMKNVLVPSVRLFYPDRVISFHLDDSCTHASHVVEECLSLQDNVEPIDWPL